MLAIRTFTKSSRFRFVNSHSTMFTTISIRTFTINSNYILRLSIIVSEEEHEFSISKCVDVNIKKFGMLTRFVTNRQHIRQHIFANIFDSRDTYTMIENFIPRFPHDIFYFLKMFKIPAFNFWINNFLQFLNQLIQFFESCKMCFFKF